MQDLLCPYTSHHHHIFSNDEEPYLHEAGNDWLNEEHR